MHLFAVIGNLELATFVNEAGLDAIGDELASPFADSSNTMPLDATARAVEINVLESLGEKTLPEPLKPANFILT